ncbi:TonB-dependent receptor [Taibaiella helva]|uniref:hypothetical protein n=1 Tax=Taibaiella helva TaxID=2301235 RepID=UPI000E58360A|nr:hypothetical protein [Taibaiella helva]
MNLICKYIPFLAGALALTATAAHGQQRRSDTTIAGQTIEITQSYKPEIARPVKPVITPTLPNIDTTRPRFQYEVPQQTLSYTYHSVPIRPLALGRQDRIMPFQNYIKAGFGNLSSIYVDAGVGSLRSEEYETSFHFSHLSQKGPLTNQQSSRTGFDATGKYYTGGHALSAELNVLRRGNTFYGYDHDTFDFAKNGIKQVFTGANVKVGMENTEANRWNIWYKPMLEFGMYSDKYNARERVFAFDVPASIAIDSTLSFSLGVRGNFTQFKNDSSNIGNNLIQVNPALDVHFSNTSIHIGISPTWGRDNTCYLLPDLRLKANLFNSGLALVGGWKGDLVQNTYQQLSTKNPFLYNIYDVKQSKTDQVYGGFESALAQHVSFGGTLSWRQWKDLALFVNDYGLSTDGKQFAVVYDSKVQAISLDAFIRYQVGNVFGLSASGTWYNFYKTTTFDKAFHEPMLRLGGSMYIHPLQQLHININGDFWDGIYAMERNGDSHKLKAFFDLSAGAEYNIIPRLSIFLQLNNILGTKYERWNQYQTYGFNIIGGLRFKF